MPLFGIDRHERHFAIDHAKRRAKPFERVVVGRIESVCETPIAKERPCRRGSFRTRIRRDRQFHRHALIFSFGFLPHEHELVAWAEGPSK